MRVTNKHELKHWFATYTYRGMVENFLRWQKYRKEMVKMGKTEYRYANRWNRFIENIEHFESDEALKRKLEYMGKIYIKEKTIEDVLQKNKKGRNEK